MIYLDHNATKPPLQYIIDKILPFVHLPLNSSSLHQSGRFAKKIINESRNRIINSLNAKCYNVIFCSSATESINTIFNCDNFDNIFCLTTDHESSINNPKSILINVDKDGLLDLNNLKLHLDKNYNKKNLVSFCLANNQSGVIQNSLEIIKLCKSYTNTLIHADCVQFIGKEFFSFSKDEFDFDFVSISSHKIGGINGCGLMIYKSNIDIKPLMYGGGQESFKRPGTENILAILSCSFALEFVNNIDYIEKYKSKTKILQNTLETFLSQNQCIIFSQNVSRVANTTFFAMQNCKNYIQLVEYDLNSICVSSGSACSSGKTNISHVLLSMGVAKDVAQNAIRISLDIENTKNDIDKFCEVFLKIKSNL